MEINADIGEMTGADVEIMPHISIGNIACGYHVSNPDHMAETVRLAVSHGVKISAHPSYFDLENFGRISVPHTAEEIVAEVFYRLWIKRNKIHIRVSIKKYMFKSVYNISMNHLKHIGIVNRYKDLNIVLHKEKEIFSGNYSNSPLAILEYNELDSLVNESIDNLPDQCREVFTMNRFKGMKYHEIAKSLDISLSTVKYHMSTALNTMKVKLNGYLDS